MSYWSSIQGKVIQSNARVSMKKAIDSYFENTNHDYTATVGYTNSYGKHTATHNTFEIVIECDFYDSVYQLLEGFVNKLTSEGVHIEATISIAVRT